MEGISKSSLFSTQQYTQTSKENSLSYFKIIKTHLESQWNQTAPSLRGCRSFFMGVFSPLLSHTQNPDLFQQPSVQQHMWLHRNRVPREVWVPHPWRYSGPQMEPWVADGGVGQPRAGCGAGGGWRSSQPNHPMVLWSLRTLPTTAILWFYENYLTVFSRFTWD